MFKLLFNNFGSEIQFLNLFRYISFRALAAAVTALLISLLLGPVVIRALTKLKQGQVIRRDGPESHFKKAGTPTMGGLLIILAVEASLLLWQDFSNVYMWLILIAIIPFGILGFLDDYLKISRGNSDGLQGRVKLIGQFIIATSIVLFLYFNRQEITSLFYVPFQKDPITDMGLWYIPFGILMIMGFSNAVNLTDGLDGLASGILITTLLAIAIITYLTGHARFADYLNIPFIAESGEITVAALALAGAVTGFLWFNSNPAEIFMGDTGSLMLGGILGVISLIIKKEILLLIIGGCFILETVSVMIQIFWFKRTGKRVFKMAPIHHHFELSGWSETKVVTRFWILGGMFAIVGLSTLKIQ